MTALLSESLIWHDIISPKAAFAQKLLHAAPPVGVLAVFNRAVLNCGHGTFRQAGNDNSVHAQREGMEPRNKQSTLASFT